jgi:hypothetical protein
MLKQRTFVLCVFANALLSTSISAAAFGRFRALNPSGRNHHEYERENDNDNDDEDKASRGKKQQHNTHDNDDLVDDKRRRQRQLFQRKQQQQQKESSWLDGMELEDDYHIPTSDHNDEDLDHDDHHHALLDSEQTHPLLQIPCAMHVDTPGDDLKGRSQPVRTFCDTGAQRTVMSWDCAQRTGLLQHLDRRYAGQAMGVGSCRVLGRIPAGIGRLTLNGQVSIPSPAITVLESTTGGSSSNGSGDSGSHDATAGVELLLGLDFLREYDAILNLRTEELELIVDGAEEVRIPFIRPRSSSHQSSSSSSRGGASRARGGASASTASASASTSTARQRYSSSSSSYSDASDERDDSYSRTSKSYQRDQWEGEDEDDDEESDDMSEIDMSGV